MLSIGPFSVRVAAVAMALLLAWLLTRFVFRRQDQTEAKNAAELLLNAASIGLIAARLAYVLRWWPDYLAAPGAIIAIGDGGFYWWAGLPAALLFVWWRSRASRSLRQPVLSGMAVGMLAWAGVQAGLSWQQQASALPLPPLSLQSLDADTVSLQDFSGQPMVLNLWATWCPPCRRELPVFEQAQSLYPQVAFVLLNQGEDEHAVRDYLAQQNLDLQHVLLDARMQLMQDSGSKAMPTTLFFDAQGRLIQSHLGELTAHA